MICPLYPGPRLVSLLDGTLCFSDSEAYRHEQEARNLCALGPLARADALFAIGRERGGDIAAAIRVTMHEIDAVAPPALALHAT